jgi:Ca2+-binding EF-hand superfamily protein
MFVYCRMDVQKLKEAFYNFDDARSGTINVEHLRVVMQTEGDDMPDVCPIL